MSETDTFAGARTSWLEQVAAAQFQPLDGVEGAPSRAIYQSIDWDKLVFRDRRGPHSTKAEVERSFRVGAPEQFDMLRHRYELTFKREKPDTETPEDAAPELEKCRLEVTVSEGTTAYHVQVRLAENPDYWGEAPRERAVSVARALFRDLPEDCAFSDHEGPPAGLLSSNAALTLTQLDTPAERIDALLGDDEVIFVLYKLHWEYDVLVKGDAWFSDEFRKAHG